jgi:Tol biopolymer transport system component
VQSGDLAPSSIMLVNANGGKPRRLFTVARPRREYIPRFAMSPDGAYLALDVYREPSDEGREGSDIHLVTIDTGASSRLTRSEDCWGPCWASDSTRLAHVRGDEWGGAIWAVRSDGTEPRQLTSGEKCDRVPLWSPDGRKMIFSRAEGDWPVSIWSMNGDGSEQRPVASETYLAGLSDITDGPATWWSPDGEMILFLQDDVLCSVKADASAAPTRLADGVEAVHITQ